VRDFVGADRALKRLNLIRTKDVMSPAPPKIKQQEPIESARRMLDECKCDRLILVDGDNRLIGYVDAAGLRRSEGTVTNAMDSNPVALPAYTSLKDALSVMFAHGVDSAVVIDDKKAVIGLLEEKDIRRAMKERNPR